MVLPVGSVLRAETDATIDASHPNALVISTPPPFVSTFDPPHADLTAAPFYTPAPMRPRPLPHGKPTLPPKIASPSPAPDTPASTASGVPAATASGVPAAAASGVPASAAATPKAASATPSPSAT
jgi:hypothetical protein